MVKINPEMAVYAENVKNSIKRQIRWAGIDNTSDRDIFLNYIIKYCEFLMRKPFKQPKSKKNEAWMKLNRLQITLDQEIHDRLGTTIHIRVSRSDDPNDIHIQRIVPENDFESYWDYVWNACKVLLDDELKKDVE